MIYKNEYKSPNHLWGELFEDMIPDMSCQQLQKGSKMFFLTPTDGLFITLYVLSKIVSKQNFACLHCAQNTIDISVDSRFASVSGYMHSGQGNDALSVSHHNQINCWTDQCRNFSKKGDPSQKILFHAAWPWVQACLKTLHRM